MYLLCLQDHTYTPFPVTQVSYGCRHDARHGQGYSGRPKVHDHQSHAVRHAIELQWAPALVHAGQAVTLGGGNVAEGPGSTWVSGVFAAG